MNEYKIGYYYHNADSRGIGVHLLLTFDGSCFSFRIIDEALALLPDINDCKEPYNRKYPSYSLANPVLFKEHFSDSQGFIIDEIVFLKNIPIRDKYELRNEGYEIYAPFIEHHTISNPCLSDLLCICDFSGGLILDSSVYYNGKEIISPLRKKRELPDQPQKNITLFNHLVVSGVVLKKIIDECNSFEKYAAFLHNPYHNYYYGYDKKASHDKEIDLIIHYIDGLNINDIIDSISADISLDYSYYRGEIDDSFYTLNIRIPDIYASFRHDCYLSAHIRGHVLSDRYVYKTGPVDSQELQRIKANLKDSYSQVEHVACLLAEWQSYAFHNCYYKHYWEDYLAVIHYALNSYYHLDVFAGGYDSPFKKKYTKELGFDLYHNTDKYIAIFNDDLKTLTVSNLDGEKYDRFYSDLLANIVFVQHAVVCHDVHYEYDYPPGIWHNDRITFNYSLRDMRVWPPNLNNGMALNYSIRYGSRSED